MSFVSSICGKYGFVHTEISLLHVADQVGITFKAHETDKIMLNYNTSLLMYPSQDDKTVQKGMFF